MTEKIIIHIEVDGDITTLEPVDMGEGRQDAIYRDDISFYRGGDTNNKEHTFALYRYSFHLSRHKFDDEREMEFKP